MSIKNCEHFKMLPCLQISKLACHHFMNAGKRYKTLGSEMKVSIKFDQELQSEKKFNWRELGIAILQTQIWVETQLCYKGERKRQIYQDRKKGGFQKGHTHHFEKAMIGAG